MLHTEMKQAPVSDPFAAARHRMVERQLRARGISDERVLQAMERVPRHDFVEPSFRDEAYEDHPLPIACGQTISQPYIVAITLHALSLRPEHTVLEVGAGLGYQTALLAELCAHVYSIERHDLLVVRAQAILSRLGYSNVIVVTGDGSRGLAAHAPFDAIAVSAATPQLPSALLDQLKEGGRMVIPVGPPEVQELQRVERRQGRAIVTHLEGCRFVPLVSP